jgi:hypothetical protein
VTVAAASPGFVLTLHQGFARAFLIYSVFLALWGLFLWVRGSNPVGGYLGALFILEGLAILQGLVGVVLFGEGHRPHDALHFLYGIVAVLTLPTAYFLSAEGTERRDSLVFGLATLFMVGVAIRGITTGGG